ncbi:hypothetical protein EB796_024669 [Bugula neritina]|uniref:Uncharacterized protein n=1 Tax=Bugula neritina TaxID=10212 RepID=A0A7J7ISW6_BUGNE|nr:hypothetical protein EB796_024669 [Bugula neritina]
MQGLLGEFKNLYEGRLGKLKAKIKADSTLEHDDNSYSTEIIQNYEAQVKVYESYVKDLGEQNEVLVQTVEQLESEANDRVNSLEAKLNKAVSTAKECNQKAKGYEVELQSAVSAKRKHEDIIGDLQDRYRRLERRYNEVEDNRAALEHDLHSLVTVISIARRTGRWQLEAVKLRKVDFNRVFGESTPLKQSPKIQELNAEINQKSLAIGQLQAELGAVRADYDQLLATSTDIMK